MPACQGRPAGPCPDNRNDKTVHPTQGDLFLCDACDKFRFPVSDRRQATTTATSASTRKTVDSRSSRSSSSDVAAENRQPASEDSRTSGAVSSNRPKISDATAAAPAAAAVVTNLIVDELLSYVAFYRNKSSMDAIRRIVLNFYGPGDIAKSKRTLIGQFSAHLSLCSFIADRRNSTTRAAHEAEVDDILNILDIVDLGEDSAGAKFVASNLDNIPKYGPEETNLASIVERQLRTEVAVADMAAAVEHVAANRPGAAYIPDIEATNRLVTELQQKLETFSSSVCARIDQLNNVCNTVCSRANTANTASSSSSQHSPQTAADNFDRRPNLIIFGIKEDRDPTVWRKATEDVLKFVAGRQIDIVDIFRLGHFVANGNDTTRKPRPILVKLRVVWDKRIVLSSCGKLKDYSQRGVFITPDEPIEVRRKNTFERLKYRAVHAGQRVAINDDILSIDDVAVFSLKDGYIRNVNG